MKAKLILTTLALGITTAVTYALFPLRVDIDASASTGQINIGAGADGEAYSEKVDVGVKIKKPRTVYVMKYLIYYN